MTIRVTIQTSDFNLSDEVEVLRKNDKRVGAICTFTGTVRDRNDGLSVSSMELEHYP
ncbi:MAG: molybdenum cofactor biosynthesis protein MoaE, partial [Polaromonas sp.]